MTALSDTLTVSLVLVLLFGSIALYLYTRIQQAEQRINLLESILLELKMSSEVKSYTELPADETEYSIEPNKYPAPTPSSNYRPFDETDEDEDKSEASSVTSKHSVQSVKPLEQHQEQQEQREQQLEQEQHQQLKEVDDVDFYKSVLDNVNSETKQTTTKVSVNYESMNIKELHSLAKQRGITGATTMKKQAIIDALKGLDRSESGSSSNNVTGLSSSFLETSSFLGQEETPSRTITIDE